MWTYNYSNELYHHGVIGQKWGIRRYQPYPTGASKGTFIGEKASQTRGASVANNKPSAAETIAKKKKIAHAVLGIAAAGALAAGGVFTYKAINKHNLAKRIIQTELSKMNPLEMNAYMKRYNLNKKYSAIRMAEITGIGKDMVSTVLSTTTKALGVTSAAIGVVAAVDKWIEKSNTNSVKGVVDSTQKLATETNKNLTQITNKGGRDKNG